MATADLYGQILLGQIGQLGQRGQSSRAAMAQRLMAQSLDGRPVYSAGAALAKALSGGLAGWMAGDAERSAAARQQELMGQLLQREQQQNEEAARYSAMLYGRVLDPGSAPAAAPGFPGSAPATAPGGGGMQPPIAPPAAVAAPADGDPRSLNMEAARRREAVLGNTSLTPEQQAQGLAEVSAWRAGAGGTPPIPGGYRANPGVDGAFAGVAPPSGMVPPVVPGGGAPAAGQGSQQINMQVLQEMLASPNPRVRDQAQAALQVLQYQRLAGPLPPEVEAQRIRINQAGRPQVNVRLPPMENSFAQRTGTDLAEEASTLTQGGQRATETLRQIDRFERALQDFDTGAAANTRLTLGQWAQRLGVPDNMLPAGLDRSAVASGEQMRAITGQMLVNMIGPGGFPAQNFSNADREMIERAMPNISTSAGGNRLLLQAARAGAQRSVEVAQALRDWQRQHGVSAESYLQFQRDRLPQITQRDILVPILGNAQAAPGAGGVPIPGGGGMTAAPPATQQQPVRVATPEEARRLPSGTPILLPDGSVGRVP